MKKNNDTGALIAKIGIIVGIVLIALSFGIFILKKMPDSSTLYALGLF